MATLICDDDTEQTALLTPVENGLVSSLLEQTILYCSIAISSLTSRTFAGAGIIGLARFRVLAFGFLWLLASQTLLKRLKADEELSGKVG